MTITSEQEAAFANSQTDATTKQRDFETAAQSDDLTATRAARKAALESSGKIATTKNALAAAKNTKDYKRLAELKIEIDKLKASQENRDSRSGAYSKERTRIVKLQGLYSQGMAGTFKPATQYKDAVRLYKARRPDATTTEAKRRFAPSFADQNKGAATVQRQAREERTTSQAVSSTAGISSAEYASLNTASKRALKKEFTSGRLRPSGTPLPKSKYSEFTRDDGVRVVGTNEYVQRKASKLYQSKIKQQLLAANKRGEFIRASPQRDYSNAPYRTPEKRRELTPTPLTTYNIQKFSGQAEAPYSTSIRESKPTRFKEGVRVSETTFYPQTAAQSQILGTKKVYTVKLGTKTVQTIDEQQLQNLKSQGGKVTKVSYKTGKPDYYSVSVPNKPVTTPSLTDQKLSRKVRTTPLGGLGKVSEKYGSKLSNWAEQKLKASREKSRALGAKKDQSGEYMPVGSGLTSWRSQRYKEAAQIGGAMQGFGETVRTRPSKIVVGATIGAGFTILTRGASMGAGAIAGKTILSKIAKQGLIRGSQLGTVTGWGMTAAYGYDVASRSRKATTATASGRVFGAEVPGLMGVMAGASVANFGLTSVQAGVAARLNRKVVGQPLTAARANTFKDKADFFEGEPMVFGRELKGVKVTEGSSASPFGIKGLQEQRPVFGAMQSFPLGKAPRSAPYYLASGQSKGVFRIPTGKGVVESTRNKAYARVVTADIAARAGKTSVTGYNYPELGNVGLRGTFAGEAFLRFSPAEGGLTTPRSGAPAVNNPSFGNMAQDSLMRSWLSEVEISEVPTPKTVRGFRSSPAATPKSSVSMSMKPSSPNKINSQGNLGGLSNEIPELPGVDFNIGGQQSRLIFDTWEPTLKPGGGKKPGSDSPFIVEGVTFDGIGRASGRGSGDFTSFIGDALSVGRRGRSNNFYGSDLTPDVNTGTKRSQSTRLFPGQDFFTGQDQAQTPISALSFDTRQIVTPFQDTSSRTTTTPVFDVGTPTKPGWDIPPPDITPSPPPDIPPPFFPLPSLGIPPGKNGKSKNSRGRGYNYAPSLLGLQLGIKSKRRSKTTFGLGIRGL